MHYLKCLNSTTVGKIFSLKKPFFHANSRLPMAEWYAFISSFILKYVLCLGSSWQFLLYLFYFHILCLHVLQKWCRRINLNVLLVLLHWRYNPSLNLVIVSFSSPLCSCRSIPICIVKHPQFSLKGKSTEWILIW